MGRAAKIKAARASRRAEVVEMLKDREARKIAMEILCDEVYEAVVKRKLEDPLFHKALTDNIQKEWAGVMGKNHEIFYVNEIAVILWQLHDLYGFGEKRLKKFCEAYNAGWRRLRDYYQMEDMDVKFIARTKLEEAGIHIEDWFVEGVAV